ADCSLVRGTRTRQPNSGLVSNQDSSSRSTTWGPTTATVCPEQCSVTAAAAVPSGTTTVCWSVVVPPQVSATGVSASRPAASRAVTARAISAGSPTTTTETWSATDRLQSVCRSAASTRWTSPPSLLVSGTPAYSGTEEAVLTPGTISKGTPARRQACASATRPLNAAGSPSMRRTTRPPAGA